MAKRISIENIRFTSGVRADLLFWQKTSPKTVEKINRSIEAIIEEPSKGLGKPEKLKYELTGFTPRYLVRIDQPRTFESKFREAISDPTEHQLS